MNLLTGGTEFVQRLLVLLEKGTQGQSGQSGKIRKGFACSSGLRLPRPWQGIEGFSPGDLSRAYVKETLAPKRGELVRGSEGTALAPPDFPVLQRGF
jgi:hypothetical protein